MADVTWRVARDPARPNWPGVLVVGPKALIAVEAGEPPNFADSKALADRIAGALLDEEGHAQT